MRLNPGARIIATGCACRIDPQKYNKAFKTIDNIERLALIKDIKPEPEKARYFLKIQDGCNCQCNYCIVPTVRDRIISKNLNEVINEIAWVQKRQYREVVLVGANLGLYGYHEDWSLIDLCHELARIPKLPRIRLSSIEPSFLTSDLLDAFQLIPLCPHFHIPIQSADDYVLEQMGRTYSAANLEQRLILLSDKFNRPALGADIIVGFPGEDDISFNNTYRFVERNKFTHLHVFPYSPRPGTRAWTMNDPVPSQVKKNRLHALYDLIKGKQQRFKESMIGLEVDVIFDRSGPRSSGLTDNYLRVFIDKKVKLGSIYKVKITSAQDLLLGKIVEPTITHEI